MAGAGNPLPGGSVTTVVRVADTVRRAPPANAEFVHAVLGWFEQRGWEGAPRFLGTDELGREVVSFIEGHVAWEPSQPPSVTADASLSRVAELVREFHDLTAGTPLAAGREVVCHNDLAPKNTVSGCAPAARPARSARPSAGSPATAANWPLPSDKQPGLHVCSAR